MISIKQLVRLIIARVRESRSARQQEAFERRVVARILSALSQV